MESSTRVIKVLSDPDGTWVAKVEHQGQTYCVRAEKTEQADRIIEKLKLLGNHPNVPKLITAPTPPLPSSAPTPSKPLWTSYTRHSLCSLGAFYRDTAGTGLPEILQQAVWFQLAKLLGWCKLKAVVLLAVHPRRLLVDNKQLTLLPAVGMFAAKDSNAALCGSMDFLYYSLEQLLCSLDGRCANFIEVSYPSDIWSAAIAMIRPIPERLATDSPDKVLLTTEKVIGIYSRQLRQIIDEVEPEIVQIDQDIKELENLKAKLSKAKVSQSCLKLLNQLFEIYEERRSKKNSTASGFKKLVYSCLKLDPKARTTPIESMAHPALQAITGQPEVIVNGVDVRPQLMNFTPLEAACYEAEIRRFSKPSSKH